MDNEKLLKALGRLSVETGSPACLGCGWEHDCNTHGCAILRGVRFALEDAEARADEAEASLAAAVRDMEAMAATIRARPIDDTECCFLCKYDGPVEDYCPGWEGEECFRWRGTWCRTAFFAAGIWCALRPALSVRCAATAICAWPSASWIAARSVRG